MESERLPPNSNPAEEAVIALVLAAAPECLPKLADLRVDDFFFPEHRTIWEAVRAVEKARGVEAVNAVTVWEELQAGGNGRRVTDGSSGLMELMARAPAVQQLEHHALLVREKAMLRQAILHAQEVTEAAYAGTSAKEVLAMVWQGAGKLETLGLLEEPVAMDEALIRTADRIALRHGELGDVKTGLGGFDQKIHGLGREQFIVVASGPGVGKSSLGAGICRRAAVKQRVPALIISQEMAVEEVVERMVAGETRTPIDDVATGRAWKAFHDAAKILEKSPLWIDDRPMTIEEVLGTVYRWYARHVVKPNGPKDPLAIVLVDYLQILTSSLRTESRERELGIISRSLKKLAKQIHSPVIGISGLNREGQKKGDVPVLQSLRGSGSIEYDADMVLFLHREMGDDPEQANATGPAKLIIAKNRGGKVGVVHLTWDGTFTSFYSEDERTEDPEPPPRSYYNPEDR